MTVGTLRENRRNEFLVGRTLEAGYANPATVFA